MNNRKGFPSNEELKRKCSWKEIPIAGAITRRASALENKTGTWRAFRPVIDEKKCINCDLCVVHCPDNSIVLKNGKRSDVNLEYCKGCGICAEICPVKAIKMVEESKFNE